MKRTEQKEQRRKKIIFAALDVFTRKGYAAAKIQDIAGKAGMSVGLMFHYFGSKEKLYEELIRLGISGPSQLLGGIKARGLAFFETAAREIFTFSKTEPYVANFFVLMTQVQYNDAAPETVRQLLADMDFISILEKKIRQGQRAGTIKKGNPTALAVAFWSAVSGIAGALASTPELPVPESDWVVDILRKRVSDEENCCCRRGDRGINCGNLRPKKRF